MDIEHFPYPCVVKASKGEDSMAVRLAKDPDSLPSALKHALSYSDTVIIERCVRQLRNEFAEPHMRISQTHAYMDRCLISKPKLLYTFVSFKFE